ncbi:MAG TPA: hypothetical protein VK540_07465 [Polyangiaceae bacterium]|nr:hypothetical protein [Polyangiaceae bacterium]
MKKGLSRITKGCLAFACAGIIACGGHETGEPDPSTGAGGAGGGGSPFDGSMAVDGSRAADGSKADGAPSDGGNQPETDANGGRGGSSSNDASSMPDASSVIDARDAMDGATVVDVAMQDRTAGDAPVADVSDGMSVCTLELCRNLPHVTPWAPVECRAGQCYIPPGSCDVGFGHCTSNPMDGCETSFSRAETCGSCAVRCTDQMQCVPQGSRYTCLPPTCSPPFPDLCGNSCVDLKTDVTNCGTCNHICTFDNASARCESAKCVVDSCFEPGTADCTDVPGCETKLGTRDNCLACGNKACAAINTVVTCDVDTSCATPACAPGYANCDATAGCETALASATAPCVPQHAGTTVEGTRSAGLLAAALAGDGSYVIGGSFDSVIDFDPSAAMDVRTPTPGGTDGFITRFNADGSYGWTRTLSGVATDSGSSSATTVTAVAVHQDGTIVATGWYQGAVDFDPGPGSDIHVTVDPSAQEPFVVKMTAAGTLVWARTFVVSNSTWNVASALAVDESGGVYVGGAFQGTLDFDPGPGADVRAPNGQDGFVVKLDSGGNYLWARSSVHPSHGSSCSDTVLTMAFARDGVVWAGGSVTCGFDPLASPGSVSAMLSGFTAVSGSVRGSYFFGSSCEAISGVASAPDGSVYAVGAFNGPCDFDPGVGIVERTPIAPAPAGFVLNLAADGALRWVQTIPDATLTAVAVMSDGSVLAVGNGQSAVWNGMPVVRWKADHTSAWTFAAGSNGTIPSVVAVGATGFIVAGINDLSGDFDPGAGADIVVAGVSFISRYTF